MAFERSILEVAARPDELRSVYLVCARIELTGFAGRLAAQHRETLRVSIVEDFGYLSRFVRQAEISFIDHERAAKSVEKFGSFARDARSSSGAGMLRD